jgi:hypothetical protein
MLTHTQNGNNQTRKRRRDDHQEEEREMNKKERELKRNEIKMRVCHQNNLLSK